MSKIFSNDALSPTFPEPKSLLSNAFSPSQTVYERDRRLKLEGKKRVTCILVVSSLLAICSFTTISLLIFNSYWAYLNFRDDYLDQIESFCYVFDQLVNVQTISTSVGAGLIVYYILLFKRRVFLRDRFKYRNVGIPMVISSWNKTDRLFTSFVYGLIALNVFEVALFFSHNKKLFCFWVISLSKQKKVLYNILEGNSNVKRYVKPVFTDPTGLISLLFKILEVLLIGLSMTFFVPLKNLNSTPIRPS
jgi:hypothetical protein